MSPRRSSRSPCRPITPGIPETYSACRPPDRSAWVRATTPCTSCFARPTMSAFEASKCTPRPRAAPPPFVVVPTLVAGQDNRCVGHHPGEKYAGGTYNATLPYATRYDITIVATDGSNPPSGVAFSVLLTP